MGLLSNGVVCRGRRCRLLASMLVFAYGCGVYSFTGVAISPQIKTLSIVQFYNNALLGPSDLGNIFSEKLRLYFERNTSLRFVPEAGDIQLSGQIESYQLTPIAPTATTNNNAQPDFAALTRLSIRVSVTYINTKDNTFNFEQKDFSFFIDFDQNRIDINAQERELVDQILDQIAIDVFNQSLANW